MSRQLEGSSWEELEEVTLKGGEGKLENVN